MNFRDYSSLTQTLKKLKRLGYRGDFKFKNQRLVHTGTGTAYAPNQMLIVEHHRFEGMTNPSDMSILFVLEAEDGTKGTLVSGYGIYADIKLIEFLDKVKIKESNNVLQQM